MIKQESIVEEAVESWIEQS